jgi:hypothetical protein
MKNFLKSCDESEETLKVESGIHIGIKENKIDT